MAKQLNLLRDPRKNTKLWWIVKHGTYGGSLDYRKVRRPFDSKKLSHCVFKAKLGKALRFSRFDGTVRQILKQAADRYGIRVNSLSVQHDHIHVLFYTKSREAQTRFLRFFSAEMGRRYARLRKRLGIKPAPLWLARPFTRLVGWGKRSLAAAQSYIRRNTFEALGYLPYRPRQHHLQAFLKTWEKQQQRSSTA